MNPYLMSLPTVTAALIVLYFSLRALREARIADAVHKAEYEKKMAEFARQRAEREAAGWKPPTVLRLTLNLRDSDAVADIANVARNAEQMVADLSSYETAMGGRGFIWTEMKAEPGQVILTLTPKDATGAGSRVERVAEKFNATSNLGSLSNDMSGAVAVAAAA